MGDINFFFVEISYDAVIPINDNTLNTVTTDDLRSDVTQVWHNLDVPDPATGLVLLAVYPSENITLTVYIGFDEQPTEDEYFVNLTVGRC